MKKFGKIKDVIKIVSMVFAYISCLMAAYEVFISKAHEKGLLDTDDTAQPDDETIVE